MPQPGKRVTISLSPTECREMIDALKDSIAMQVANRADREEGSQGHKDLTKHLVRLHGLIIRCEDALTEIESETALRERGKNQSYKAHTRTYAMGIERSKRVR
jgi:hypothetical protein